ncbi:MAG TPA: HlyD family efflux transporter periplasmic adaptor subunit, partial [Labilithrix sp.]|nr:HlyD family efflux transporter periplasmic adaptor subunit [Labilithrix sp.]
APPSLSLFFGAVTALLFAGLMGAVFGRIQIPLEGRGAVHPSERPTTLRAQRSGRIASLAKAPGDSVKKNETIARLDAESEVASLEACRRELTVIRTDAAALDDRAATASGTDVLFAMQRTRAHDRRASLEVRCGDLERGLANASVTAPIDGVVARIDVVPGDSIRDGDVVAAVARPGVKLVGSIQLPEARRTELEVGRGVRLVFDAFPVEKFGTGHGRILRLSSTSGDPTRAGTDKTKEAESITADVEIESLPRGVSQAEPGMTFTGHIDTNKIRLISLLVPSTSP